MDALRKWSEKKTSEDNLSPPKARLLKRKDFPATVTQSRFLTVNTSGILLDRFDRVLKGVSHDTLVDEIEQFRLKGLSAHSFLNLVVCPGDEPLDTGREKLAFLCYGSPKLRYIHYQIHTYVLPQSIGEKARKILITEDIPLTAWYWEIVIEFLYIDVAILHSGLSNNE